jgi:hypothetical protein
MGHSIRESDGESFEDHGNGQEMTAASGPSTPLPFSLSFATPAIEALIGWDNACKNGGGCKACNK